PKEPSRRSLLAKIWWQARERFGPAPADLPGEKAREEIHDVLRRLPADFASPPSPENIFWCSPDEGREEEQIEFSWARETLRLVGTVVHRWLQRIAEDELRGWDASRIDSLQERFSNELSRRGV